MAVFFGVYGCEIRMSSGRGLWDVEWIYILPRSRNQFPASATDRAVRTAVLPDSTKYRIWYMRESTSAREEYISPSSQDYELL
jgi:hypothetical protein